MEVRALPPEPMSDQALPPSSTPRPGRAAGSGRGCLLAALALPVVILLGLVVGKALGGGDEPDDERVALDSGQIDGREWRVDAVRDVEGDVCAFLYEGGEQLSGACDDTPQAATFGDQTVVFGYAGDREAVEVELSDGRVVSVDTVEAGSVEGRFYVQVVDGDVDAEGLAPP